jgi:acyl transferase domain-containing protein
MVEPLAIVGAGCRLPGGVRGLADFWHILHRAIDVIRDVPSDRWDGRRFRDPDPRVPGRMRDSRGGFLSEDIWEFDPLFFGIPPRVALSMDPQQRLLLEVTWEAFEDAGLVPERHAGDNVGVYFGGFTVDNLLLSSNPRYRDLIGEYTATGGTLGMLSNRVSHIFDFRGPSITIDTACSSSLVAFHYACQDLWSGRCSLAVTGGVNLMLVPETPIVMSKGGFLAADSRSKAFDARADGYGRGEGAGVAILKPLTHALRDGDRIHALVRATGVNQDGRTPGITAPNLDAQIALLRAVYDQAGVRPADVAYVEAHGTGTVIGDATEAAALGTVVGAERGAAGPCLIGSAKTNVGHLEAAAGIVGILKTMLCLEHREVPPLAHFQFLNQNIPFRELGLQPATTSTPLRNGTTDLFAAVNSFGFGGTNAHALLQAHSAAAGGKTRAPASPAPADTLHFLPISAHSEDALATNARNYLDWLRADGGTEPGAADLCHMAAVRRTHHRHRLLIVGATRDDLVDRLEAWIAGQAPPLAIAGTGAKDTNRRVCFVYTGMGPQEWGMGRDLLATEPAFRAAAQAADAAFADVAGWSALEAIGKAGARGRVPNWIAQPANFVFQVGLSALWRSWGVEPAALVGHSVGEIAAAYDSGALDLADAARLCFHRSHLQERRAGTGGMLAASLGAEEASRLIRDFPGVDIGAINGAQSVTLSGDERQLDRIAGQLAGRGTFCRRLEVEVPYHSFEMDPIEAPLLQALQGLRPRAPKLALYSTVTGARVEGADLGADYWWRNVRQPVRFAAAVDALAEAGLDLFLEVGPRTVLASAIKQQFGARAKANPAVVSIDRRKGEREAVAVAFGRLYAEGAAIDWARQHDGRRRFVPLPPYAWQRTRLCWEPANPEGAARHPSADNVLLGHRLSLPDPTWQSEISEGYLPYLKDHQLRGSVVFPGAAFVDMALSAAKTLGAGPVQVVENLNLLRPLILPKHGKALVRTRIESGDRALTVHSQAVSGTPAPWQLNASARVSQIGRLPGAAFDLAGALARCPAAVAGEQVAAEFARRGMHYGPAFRAIKRVHRGGGELVAEIALAPELDPAADHSLLHPTLLDAAFQSLIVAAISEQDEGALFLPSRIARVAARAITSSAVWAYARITDSSARRVRADLLLLEADGTVLAEVSGLVCQTSSLAAHADQKSGADLLYREVWQEAPAPRITELRRPATLIAGAGASVRDRLAHALEARGDTVRLPGSPAARKANGANGANGSHGANGANGASRANGADADAKAAQQIVFCCAGAAGGPEPRDPVAGVSDECSALLELVAEARAQRQRPRVTIVTAGAFDVAGAQGGRFAAAAVWGLARTLALELPEMGFRRVDLSPDPDDVEIAALASEIAAVDGEEEVALRGGARYVHAIERAPQLASEAATRVVTNAEPYAVKIGQPGKLSSLGFVSTRRKPLAPNEVELQIAATSLNFKDLLKIMGTLSDAIVEGTYCGDSLGMEAAVRVARVGAAVTRYKVGDEFVCAVPDGSFQSYVTIDADALVSVPRLPGFSFAELAGAPVVLVTTYYAMCELGRVREGETVLIHSAAGGVGHAAIEIARWKGARILATAGSDAKRAYLRSLGIDAVMDSRSLDFVEQVRAATGGRGVDFVLNFLSGEPFERSLALLAPFGRFVDIGKRHIVENQRLELLPFNENLSFHSLDIDRMLAQRPDMFRRLLAEVWELIRDRKVKPAPVTEYPITQLADACAAMRSAEHRGKIVLALDGVEVIAEDDPAQAPLFSGAGTYLVTGGLGGFGAETAKWLAARGASHLLLVGRRGAQTPGADALVAALRGAGAEVAIEAADVADRARLAAVLDSLERRGFPPLRGVFHAAGVLDDCASAELTRDRLARVMAPKAAGAWNLHELTRKLPLDHFVTFSSVAGLLGNAGQAGYAAANTLLDGLARRRAAQGLPAVSVHWGAIDEIGMAVSAPGIREQLEAHGIRLLAPQRALHALETCLRAKAPPANLAIMDVDWGSIAHARPGAGHRFASLVGEGNGHGNAGEDIRLLLADLAAPQRIDLVAGLIGDMLSEVLGIAQNALASDTPMNDQGIDSLMLTELQLAMRSSLGALVPNLEVTGADSVRGLAARIVASLDLRDDGGDDIAAQVDSMSEEEIDRMLAQVAQEQAAP